jgi:hypothetical protein
VINFRCQAAHLRPAARLAAEQVPAQVALNSDANIPMIFPKLLPMMFINFSHYISIIFPSAGGFSITMFD